MKAYVYLFIIFAICGLAATQMMIGSKVCGLLLLIINILIVFPLVMDDLNKDE